MNSFRLAFSLSAATQISRYSVQGHPGNKRRLKIEIFISLEIINDGDLLFDQILIRFPLPQWPQPAPWLYHFCNIPVFLLRPC